MNIRYYAKAYGNELLVLARREDSFEIAFSPPSGAGLAHLEWFQKVAESVHAKVSANYPEPMKTQMGL